MLVLDEGYNAHLRFTFGALKWIHFIDSLYARAPTALTELTAIVALWFFRGRRGELSAFTSSPTGVATVVYPEKFLIGGYPEPVEGT